MNPADHAPLRDMSVPPPDGSNLARVKPSTRAISYSTRGFVPRSMR